MKFNPVPVMAALLLLLSNTSFSQQGRKNHLHLKNGSFIPETNIVADKLTALTERTVQSDDQRLLVIQFDVLPTEATRRELKAAGIELLDYVPDNAYTAIVRGGLNSDLLTRVRTRAVVSLSPQQKMQPSLYYGKFPKWAVKQIGSVDIWISVPRSFDIDRVGSDLSAKGFTLLSSQFKEYRILSLRSPGHRLAELASMPFVEYVQAAPKEDVPLNDNSIANSRANVLHSNLIGGRDLEGDGVVVGVGDNANPLNHIDFNGRVINRSAAAGGQHGLHVMGTVGGGGIVLERYKGYAPKSTIIKQYLSGIWVNAPAYVQDYGMVITNNSFGLIEDDCSTFGIYDLYSRALDLQAYQLPNLQTVFATGNSGLFNCAPYANGFSNVLGGYQTAKNVINVGNTNAAGVLNTSSSKGPVRDGRIKPEITAQGTSVFSTWAFNIYSPNTGTSMAAPAVSGGLALLYQRYRQLNGNLNPKNGLMKALLMNGAIDQGNPGPDFSYGFGAMNLLRSVKMLEQANYVNDSVANTVTNQHTVVVPANTAQLKVMLYWNDPAASALASQALVNDLDLEVRNPSNVLTLPMLLDTVPANVNNNATTGVDHINNVEQVVINNPVAGSYNVRVIGTAVTQNPRQEYFLVYDTIPVSLTLTNPVGGERLPGLEPLLISWDAFGNTANDFTVQFSGNNGVTWTNYLNTIVPANQRQYSYILPDTATEVARVRVIHNGTGLQSTSGTFTIIQAPIDSLLDDQCEGYISFGWRTVPGATDYEVMMLRGVEMVSVATTTGNNYTIGGLSKDSVYWVSVRARINGNPGRRAQALSRQPNGGTCLGAMANNDLKVDTIISPTSGRLLTSTELTATTTVTARFKNLGNVNVASYNVKYFVNGTLVVSDALTNLAPQTAVTHNFSITSNFTAVGDYPLMIVVENVSVTDPVKQNDTIRVLIRQLPNDPIVLTPGNDFLDDVESADDSTYYNGQIGFVGADRYDFNSSTAFGRVRTFVNTGIARSGNRAFTLDSDRYNAGGTADSLKGTFNLVAHAATADDIRLDFYFKQHGQLPNGANKVWIRGADTLPWIEAFDLDDNQEDPGEYLLSPSLEVADLLAANGQDFFTSFQIRFGQWGQIITADDFSAAGYTFDDIRLYRVDNDLQMVSIDAPAISNCALSNATTISVTVRNAADTAITNVPVRYSINGGAPVTDIIPSIPGNTNWPHTFTTPADLSAFGSHVIVAWVDYALDTYRRNDTATKTINNSPIIASFPYLQDFEAGEAGWFSDGENNSWAFGTPSAPKINRAASGSNAWKTGLAGGYNDKELSYLYSPCFNLTGMTNPTLSLSIALDLEDCGGTFCDGAYVEYSNDGLTWTRLGASGQGTNWYNKAYAGNNMWSVENYTRWHVATIPLPTGLSTLRLRFVMSSDPFVTFEGIGVDDIHIYDNQYGIYTGPPSISNSVNQPAVSGSGWVDFTDGGKLIASVNPNGQNLGSTDAQAFIHTGAVRINSGQYYHNRNITIKPTTVNLADSATVRFYFLDTETEALINATGCPGCSKPTMAYELGVSKYSDVDDSKEDGTIANDLSGDWLFMLPSQVRKVPFDRGYYAEFKVKDFSEFWLNNGGIGNNQTLPAELLSFTARRQNNNDVLAQWKTASENNVLRFEVEVARGNSAFSQANFSRIGEITSQGNSSSEQSYTFTDLENNKSGVRYYRLKIIDRDGGFSYSAVRPVVFEDEVKWQVYPNPSGGQFNFIYQANEGETIDLRIYDVNGRMLRSAKLSSSGFVQKHSIDLQSPSFAQGLYLLEANVGERKQVFRLIKQ